MNPNNIYNQLDKQLYRSDTGVTSDLSTPMLSMDSLSSLAGGSETPTIEPELIDGGKLAIDLTMVGGQMSSANFATGLSGWRLLPNGDFEGNDGNFRGDITGATGTFSGALTGGSLNIPDTTTANSMHVEADGDTWWGTNIATGHATAPAKILSTGAATFSNATITGSVTATSGAIGGWTLGATTISSATLTLDSANQKIESTNYVSGVAGSGFHIDSDLLEAGNVAIRGIIRSTLFQKDVISTVGGHMTVLDGDVLNEDMTALDSNTLVTKGATTFSSGDVIRIKDGINDEWLQIEASPTSFLIDSYGTSNYSSYNYLYNSNIFVGQSFLNTTNCTLHSCQFYMTKSGSPTGNIVAKIYAHTGTFGSGGLATGSALAVSDTVDASTLDPSTPTLMTFTFSAANKITLSASTHYVVGLSYNGSTWPTVVRTMIDNTSQTHVGNAMRSTNESTFIYESTHDMIFYVYGDYSLPANNYLITRDKGSAYSADNNPTWKQGSTIVNYKQSGDGGIYMTASDSNAPYLSIFDHAGAPWTTINTRLRIGNLNGYLGYSSDLYGIAIGETGKSLTYDPTNGLRIAGDITLGTTNFIKGGQTAYNTGTGFFLGYDTSAYKLSLGTSSNGVTWDGSNLTINGGTLTAGVIQTTTSGERVVMNFDDNDLGLVGGFVAIDGYENTASVLFPDGYLMVQNMVANSYAASFFDRRLNSATSSSTNAVQIRQAGTITNGSTYTHGSNYVLDVSDEYVRTFGNATKTGTGTLTFERGWAQKPGTVSEYGFDLSAAVTKYDFSGSNKALAAKSYKVQIDGTGSPNTFKWYDDGGVTPVATGVSITGGSQTLTSADGSIALINFSGTTGGVLGDYWTFTGGAYSSDSSVVARFYQAKTTNTNYVVRMVQAAPTTTNFSKMLNMDGTGQVTLWISNGTSPNGSLTGTTGDVCFGCDSGKSYYCTSGTSWTAM